MIANKEVIHKTADVTSRQRDLISNLYYKAIFNFKLINRGQADKIIKLGIRQGRRRR